MSPTDLGTQKSPFTYLPVYLVLDISASMSGEPIDALNEAILSIEQSLMGDTLLGELILLGIVIFSTDAQVARHLASARDVAPDEYRLAFESGGTTHYGAAIGLLRETIEADVARLKHEGISVFRPIVFFLTDGSPTDADWDEELARLRASPIRPNIVAVGIGDADPLILKRIATVEGGAFVSSSELSPADGVRSFQELVAQSIYSYRSSVAHSDTTALVTAPEGLVTVP